MFDTIDVVSNRYKMLFLLLLPLQQIFTLLIFQQSFIDLFDWFFSLTNFLGHCFDGLLKGFDLWLMTGMFEIIWVGVETFWTEKWVLRAFVISTDVSDFATVKETLQLGRIEIWVLKHNYFNIINQVAVFER